MLGAVRAHLRHADDRRGCGAAGAAHSGPAITLPTMRHAPVEPDLLASLASLHPLGAGGLVLCGAGGGAVTTDQHGAHPGCAGAGVRRRRGGACGACGPQSGAAVAARCRCTGARPGLPAVPAGAGAASTARSARGAGGAGGRGVAVDLSGATGVAGRGAAASARATAGVESFKKHSCRSALHKRWSPIGHPLVPSGRCQRSAAVL